MAAKGSKDLTAVFEGVTYRFSSEANCQKFVEEPADFVPAYGGWCASAMSFGRKVDIDPESYVVENGRLFLFYLGIRGDGKKDWLDNQPKWKHDADVEWDKLLKSFRAEGR
jgi:YHS domain-containing protein